MTLQPQPSAWSKPDAWSALWVPSAKAPQKCTHSCHVPLRAEKSTEGGTLGSVFLQPLPLSLWVRHRLMGWTLEEGWCLALGQHLLRTCKGLLFSLPSGDWPSLLPAPAGSCVEEVNANEGEKHRGEGKDKTLFQTENDHIWGVNSLLLCAPGSGLDIAFPHLWCSVFQHYAAASRLSSAP